MPICEICKYQEIQIFHQIQSYTYCLCQNCFTLFLYPKPTSKQTSHYYTKNFKYTAGEANEKLIRTRAKSILKNLKKINPAGNKLLDIGSGYGYFLDEARKTRLIVTGVEPSKQLSSISLYRYNDIVFSLTFNQYFNKQKNKKFDFITIIHTIEHVINPKVMILNALKLLNKNGLLYLETPNLDSHLFYAEKHDYTFLTPPDHIWLFSAKSFQTMLKAILNIELVKMSSYSYPEHFMGILKKKLEWKLKKDMRSEKEIHTSNFSNPASNFQPPTSNLSRLKYLFLDKFLAPIFTPLLNLGNKGSILELYIKKI